MSFPSGAVVKDSPANAEDIGDVSSVPGLGRSPEEEMTTYFLPGKSYSPWGHRQLNTTEYLAHITLNRKFSSDKINHE